jgi:glycosyltransferase involved in cell wall biosynthesis
MNVLHLTTFGEYSTLGIRPASKDFGGGISINLFQCAEYAKKNNLYQSYMTAAWPCAFVAKAKSKGFQINVVKSKWFFLFGRPIVVLMSIKEIIKIVRKEKIQIIHAYNFAAALSGGLAAFFCRIPLVTSIHQDISDYVSDSKNCFVKILSWFRKSLILSLWRFAAGPMSKRVLPVSKFVAESVRRIGINKNKILVVNNGLDFETLSKLESKRDQFRNELGIKNQILIGSVGRLAPAKGYKYLIEAAAILLDEIDCRFVIIGDGEEKQNLQKLIDYKGLTNNVLLIGHRENIPQLMPAFDLFVLPSLIEGMPTVILEAMYAKVPVVATSICGTPEVVIDGKTGLLVRSKDPKDLTEKVMCLLQNEKLRKEIIASSFEMVTQKYSLKTKVETLQRVYESVISQGI